MKYVWKYVSALTLIKGKKKKKKSMAQYPKIIELD